MTPFAQAISGTATSLALFAPQIYGDKDAPIISLGKSFRIPVYQSYSVNLLKYLADASGVDRAWVTGDDLIKNGKTALDLVFGSYTSLLSKTVQLFVQDIPGNIAEKDMNLEVYAPIPKITQMLSRVVSGVINEALKNEPVDLFRYRNGRLDRVSTGSVLTDENGKFSVPLPENLPGVAIKNASGSTIATIQETTGKISLLNTKDLSFQVTPATETAPTYVRLLDTAGTVLFQQQLSFPENTTLEKTSAFSESLPLGIYVHPSEGYDFAKNSTQAPSLPQGGYVTDSQKKALAGISKEGNVYLLDSTLKLKYVENGAYTGYLVVDAKGMIIAEIQFHLYGEYIVQ